MKPQTKAAPVEILVDGKSIKKDGKVVEMKFHPKSYYKESKMNLKSLVKETIKEVVTERKLQMFFEKNVPTIQASGLITNHKQRKSLMFIQVHMQMVGQQNNTKPQAVVGKRDNEKFKTITI